MARLVLSGCVVVITTLFLLMLAIGFDDHRMHGDNRSYFMIGGLLLIMSLVLQRLWVARAGWWQPVSLVVLLPVALGILWMLGVLPCSTRLNCPF